MVRLKNKKARIYKGAYTPVSLKKNSLDFGGAYEKSVYGESAELYGTYNAKVDKLSFVGRTAVEPTGKNFCGQPGEFTENGITLTRTSDGKFNVSGTISANFEKVIATATVYEGTYTASGSAGILVSYTKEQWHNITNGFTFTVSGKTTVRFKLVLKVANQVNGSINNEDEYIQLEKGTAVTEFEKNLTGAPSIDNVYKIRAAKGYVKALGGLSEPYSTYETIYPVLRAIYVDADCDYNYTETLKDQTVNYIIADEVKNGNYYRKTQYISLYGQESFTCTGPVNGIYSFKYALDESYYLKYPEKMLSTHFCYCDGTDEGISYDEATKSIIFNISESRNIKTVEAFQNYALQQANAGTPIMVVFVKAEPTVTTGISSTPLKTYPGYSKIYTTATGNDMPYLMRGTVCVDSNFQTVSDRNITINDSAGGKFKKIRFLGSNNLFDTINLSIIGKNIFGSGSFTNDSDVTVTVNKNKVTFSCNDTVSENKSIYIEYSLNVGEYFFSKEDQLDVYYRISTRSWFKVPDTNKAVIALDEASSVKFMVSVPAGQTVELIKPMLAVGSETTEFTPMETKQTIEASTKLRIIPSGSSRPIARDDITVDYYKKKVIKTQRVDSAVDDMGVGEYIDNASYMLSTPTVTDITSTELGIALLKFRSLYPGMNISSNVDIEVEYDKRW